jgi:hypothetical protein
MMTPDTSAPRQGNHDENQVSHGGRAARGNRGFRACGRAQSARADITFALTGLMTLPWPTSDLVHEVAAIAPDGGIFVAHEGPSDITIMRMSPEGTLLATYVGGGIARVNLAEPLKLSAMHVEPDGTLILGGGRDLMRVASTGYLDSAFGDGGRMRIPYVNNGICAAGNVRRILKAADGAWIVVGGQGLFDASGVEQGCTLVARVGANGEPDRAFGTQGNTVRGGLIAFDARLLGDGTIEVIGRYAGQAGSWVEHLRADGGMQDSFGLRGSLRPGRQRAALLRFGRTHPRRRLTRLRDHHRPADNGAAPLQARLPVRPDVRGRGPHGRGACATARCSSRASCRSPTAASSCAGWSAIRIRPGTSPRSTRSMRAGFPMPGSATAAMPATSPRTTPASWPGRSSRTATCSSPPPRSRPNRRRRPCSRHRRSARSP